MTDKRCLTCRHWQRAENLTGSQDPGLCRVITANPFWLPRFQQPTYPDEGTWCDAWSARKIPTTGVQQ